MRKLTAAEIKTIIEYFEKKYGIDIY